MLIKFRGQFLSVMYIYGTNDKGAPTTTCRIVDRTSTGKEVASRDLPELYKAVITKHNNDRSDRTYARKAAFEKAIKSMDKASRTEMWAEFFRCTRPVKSSPKATIKHGLSNSPLVIETSVGRLTISFSKTEHKNPNSLTDVQNFFIYGTWPIKVTCNINVGSETEVAYSGYSLCSALDHFDGIFGRNLALRRAVSSLSRADRTVIWNHYRSVTRQYINP
jgi:hypothetical protein